MRRSLSLALAIVLAIACQPGRPSSAQQADSQVEVTILAINDFHGYLRPSPGGVRILDPSDRTKRIIVPAGGSEQLATLVKEIRARSKSSIFVAAGDLIGASPLLSALFRDEATIESLSAMGLDLASVGDHEFDKGKDELLRMQNGGCHPGKGCQGPHPFRGATFQYLAANVAERHSGKTLFPAYAIKEVDGIPVAFIGLTLKGTADIVNPSGVAGLEFGDEVETVNALVPQLKQRGIEAIVVLIHEGGFPTGDYNECPSISGPIVEIVKKLDKAVDLVVSGHTHRAYVCTIDDRLVTSAGEFGTIVTKIDLKLDRRTRDVVAAKADNFIVRADTYGKDPEQTRLIAAYDGISGQIGRRVVGSVTATLSRDTTPSGETELGNLVADAQLAATRAQADGGAVIAFTNPGGVRNVIPRKEDGTVTYAEIFAAQPFNNSLVTLTLTGAQIKQLLEQQWLKPAPVILHVSAGFAYTWDATPQPGARVLADSITLNGQPIDPGARYRVTVNAFLADGGDRFSVLRDGTERRAGGSDVDALASYLAANSPVSPGRLGRIRRVN